MLVKALARVALASVVSGVLVAGPLAVFGLFVDGGFAAAMLMVGIPVAMLVYLVCFGIFGLPVLWFWRAAFRPGLARGFTAAAFGGLLVLGVVAVGNWPLALWQSAEPVGTVAAFFYLAACGCLGGFVWWWLNADMAE